MPEPADIQLYEKIKKEIYEKYPKHSAYSMRFVSSRI
jgi:hypothetical protein